MAKKVQNKDLFESDVFSKTVDDVKSLIGELEKLENSLKEVAKVQAKSLRSSDNKTVKGLNRQKEAIEKINIAEKANERINKQKIALLTKLKVANSDRVQANVRLNEQLKRRKRANRDAVKETEKVFGAYTNLSAKLNRLRKEYKDLAAAEKQNTKEGRKLNATITKLDGKLKKIDKSVGQSQRSVGNYTKVWGRLGETIKRGFLAIGIVGAFRKIARVARDAFNRIKEFDSAMATIRGLTGRTTEELALLRQEIIDVAGSSRKTSNEVAKLATTLLTLGKTESEVLDLLKPVNDLAIGLEATSEEAADFLGQTLNAFQKSSESGQEFADIIANVRKSTSLDFQRLRDALGYAAPVANSLNLTLGRTTALIGVLQDNGIKAARAGRLLGTSFQRLASRGMSLEQALDSIDKAQKRGASSLEVLEIASDKFGQQAGSLGLILSKNRDRVDELADSFDNMSEGALKTLVDEQLDTLSGKLDILDSTYEKFILSIEDGEGRIGKAIRGTIKGVTDLINMLISLNTTVDDFALQAEKEETSFVKNIIGSTDDIDEVFLRLNGQLNQTKKRLKEIKKQEEEASSILNIFSPSAKGVEKGLESLVGKYQKRVELLEQALKDPSQFLKKETKETNEELEETNKQVDELSKKDKKIKLIDREQISELEKLNKQLKVIEEQRKKLVTSTDEGDIKAFNVLSEEADRLERIIDIYERILKGETTEIGEIKPGKMTDSEIRDAVEKDIDARIEKEEAAIERMQNLISDSLTSLGTLVDDLFITKMDELNANLQSTQRRTDQLINKAAASRLNAQESIAFEQKKEAELEKERQETLKRQQQMRAFFTVLEAYQSNVAAGSQSPITDTVKDIGILKALAQSFGSAYEGVDDTGGRGDIDNKGGKMWVLHPREQVWSEKNRKEVGYKSRQEIIDIVKNSEKGNLLSSEILSERNSAPKRIVGHADNAEVISGIEKLNKSIQGIEIPEGTVSIDQVRKLINVRMKKGNKTKVERSKLYD